ncbi:unnamed protein product [Lathyrus oleraceus]|uniref:transcription repressor OFP8 n=1 Tax=Pisum sativum TaxID=3888 RepID=UPI0021CE3535|nr:transcription repressor OFP8 [Pisum sativum]
MENQNRLKMRISRMFRSSFGSCKTRQHVTDVMEKPLFAPPNNPIPSKTLLSFHPISKPKPSQKTIDDMSFNLPHSHSLPRRKISTCSSSPFLCGANSNNNNNNHNPKCPSPVSPNTTFDDEHTTNNNNLGFYEKTNASSKNITNKTKKKKKKKRIKNKKKTQTQKKNRTFPFNSCAKDTNFDSYWWYSTDEEDETDTLFSSKSLSSDSSKSRRRKTSRRRTDRSSDMGVLPLNGKVKDTFAVVKRSSDPYSDFRTSMVEMIVEKQIFSPSDLENLLQCFLSLNSYHHHKIIVEVYTEIWEALFSDWL